MTNASQRDLAYTIHRVEAIASLSLALATTIVPLPPVQIGSWLVTLPIHRLSSLSNVHIVAAVLHGIFSG